MRKHTEPFDLINTALVVLITLMTVYPLYFCIVASFSNPDSVATGKTLLWFDGITLEAYRQVFRTSQIWVGYRNAIVYTALGTLYNLVLTIPAAYVLSKKDLPARGLLSWFFFVTMYFSGGMIPNYLWIRDLRLLNTPWVMIVGAGVSCYNLIITRQYFSNAIPEELYESARIDGADEARTFVRVALPLAKPIVAVIALYYGVGRWNSYYAALLYIQDHSLFPLQLVLRNILLIQQMSFSNVGSGDVELIKQQLYLLRLADTMKYAIIFIASLPLLVAYPFVQKHFTKGILVGSVKG